MMNFESNWLRREPGEVMAQHTGDRGRTSGHSALLVIIVVW